jgi:6-phosphofructokinase 2
MSNSTAIVTLTINPCLDISAEVDHVLPTKKLRCQNDRRDPGGGGINVSRAITILGGESTAVFPAGGSTGKAIADLLKKEGITCRIVDFERDNRQSFAVRELESQKQFRFALPGPAIGIDVWQKCFDIIGDIEPPPAFIVASGSLPPGVPEDYYGKLVDRFGGSDTKIVVDTSGKPLQKALDQPLYLIKPNQRELEYICDCSLEEETVQEQKCREMVEQGRCEVLALTLGPKGALLTSRDEQIRIAGLNVEEVSAVGAGDSFVGALVLALHQGRDLKDAFFYGVAAGTAALTTKATELCRREDTEKFFKILQQEHRTEN